MKKKNIAVLISGSGTNLQSIIDKAVSQLPYKYRAPFLLRYNDDLSIKEIAEIMGESVAATKSHVL